MRKIVEFFVHQPIFGDLLTLAVIIMGLGSLFLIRREVFPNVNFDVIQVSTIFPGATPEEVEKRITNPIEQDLNELEGIKHLNSYSVEGLSNIFITLDPDIADVDKSEQDAQSIVDQIADIPEEAKKTIVKEIDSKQTPIIEVSISSKSLDALALREVAKKLERELEDINGVSKIAHRGLRDREVRVELSQKKLSHYRLTLDDVSHALKRQNISIPAGVIESPSPASPTLEKSVRTVGDFKNITDVENTVIKANELGQSIRIKDVGIARYDLAKATIQNYTNGLPSLGLTVLKENNADAIKIVELVKSKIEALKPTLLKDIDIAFVNDNSEFVKRRLSILTGNLTLGLTLVLILLPLMLPFRFALLIALGEPFAFLGAILLLYLSGNSINLISMLGLIIVSGILVDDSIVVTENAVRLIEDEGMSPKEAAIEGTMQIMAPITASVLTTTLAFLPMAFMSGVFGKFIKEVPIAVIACLAVSLFETFFILPGHVAHWIQKKELRKINPSPNIIERFLVSLRQGWDQKIVPLYVKWLALTLKRRYLVATGLVLFFIFTLFVAKTQMRFVLFPPEGVEIFFVRAKTATGTGIERHAHLLKPIEKEIASLPKTELKDYVLMIGIQQQDPYDPLTRRGSEFSQYVIYLTPETERNRSAHDIIEDLRQRIGKPEGILEVTFNRVNPGPPVGKPVSLGLRSNDFPEMLAASKEIQSLLHKMKGVSDIADSYTLGKEELKVQINPSEAAASGLSVAQIGNTVRGAYEGLISSSIRNVDEKMDVRVLLSETDRTNEEALHQLFIPNQQGHLIPFNRVAKIERTRGPSIYEHEDNKRQIKVTANVDTKITSAQEVNAELRKLLPELRQHHPNVGIDFGGEDEDTQESLASLARAFMAAVVGIFLMLVLTFKRLLQPLVILITIPLGMMAVIWAFFFHGMPLSFMGMLGIIALSGVIVNNAIMLVDFINQERKLGVDNMQSILNAGKMRVRPIFLTTITTIIGILPTAYGIGGLDKFVVPIAMALGWGLLFGSILTAFVFPSALAILDDVALIFSKWFPGLVKAYSSERH